MVKYIAVFGFWCLTLSGILAQEAVKLEVSVSTDSLLMGNPLRVTYTVQGTDARQLETPEFHGFTLQSGPNYSNSFSLINGKTSRKSSISFYLLPKEGGRHFIEPAFLTLPDGNTLETSPISIEVYPNPDGAHQPLPEPDIWGDFPGFQRSLDWDDFFRMPTPPTQSESPDRKKRKTYKL